MNALFSGTKGAQTPSPWGPLNGTKIPKNEEVSCIEYLRCFYHANKC